MDARLTFLVDTLRTLTPSQREWISKIAACFQLPKQFTCNPASGLITQSILNDLGDTLRIHHAFSREPFSKDKFEYALERVMQAGGLDAVLAPRGNPGYDIVINHQRFSLKTEAAAAIKLEKLHISKFMELGGGTWGSNPQDLVGLCSGQLIPDTVLSFSSATAGASPSLN